MSWVDEVLTRYRLDTEYHTQRVLLLWETVVGPRVAKISRAEKVTNGTLWVSVASPPVSQELSFFKGQYMDRLNASAGESVVQQIRFIPGQFKQMIPKKRVCLSASEQDEAHRQFASLSDSQLRTGFERLYLTLRKRETAILAAGGRRCSRCGVVFWGGGEICPGCRFDWD